MGWCSDYVCEITGLMTNLVSSVLNFEGKGNGRKLNSYYNINHNVLSQY